jgi:hypothetical protein
VQRASIEQQRGGGWITFAGVMFMIVGAFNVIAGIAALADDNYFRSEELLFGDLKFWGWTWITLGASQLLVSYLIFKRSGAGLFLGALLAGINAIDHLVAVGAYPIWSIIVMTIDFLIIWGLLTNSDEFVD